MKGLGSLLAACVAVGLTILGGGVRSGAAVEAVVAGNPKTIIIAVAGSANADPRAAAMEAAKAAIDACGGQAKGLIVYEDTGTEQAPATQAVVAGLQAVADGLPYIGAHAVPLTTTRTIRGGVAVMAIGGEGVQVATSVAPLNKQRKITANELSRPLKSLNDPKLVFVLSEPTLSFEPDKDVTVEDFLVGMKDNFGPTPIFGGNCKPHDEMVGYQFKDGQIYTSHVVGMAVSGPFRTIADHTTEFPALGEAVTVTKGLRDPEDGKWWIIELNNRPAAEVYREIRGMRGGEAFSYDQEHAVGVVVTDTRRYLRMVLDEGGTTEKNQAYAGGIKTITEVPVGTQIYVLGFTKRAEDIYASAAASIKDIIQRAGQAKPLAILSSDCCARGFRLWSFTRDAGDEVIGGIQPAMQGVDVPYFGFYAYGEIGPIRGPFKGLDYMYQQHTYVGMMLVEDANAQSCPGTGAGLGQPVSGCCGQTGALD